MESIEEEKNRIRDQVLANIFKHKLSLEEIIGYGKHFISIDAEEEREAHRKAVEEFRPGDYQEYYEAIVEFQHMRQVAWIA